MYATHPKLVEIVVDQTPRAMIAMLIVSSAFGLILFKFIPLSILLVWFFFQILLAACRLYNAKIFKAHLEDQVAIKKNEVYFIALNLFQAAMWTIASVLVMVYAPRPFEFVIFVVIIGVITASTLSMSSLYRAYLFFFFAMIIPQIIILLHYGEHQHIGLVAFILIYIPATILLSKAILNSRISSIEAHEELEVNAEELRKLAITDTLTNIYNRRYFFEMSHNIILIAAREQKKVSLLMLDIDFFKNINDSYGHQAGDFILKNLVKDIKKVIRKSDIFARIGGEEFSLILNDTPLEGARVLAEKIRKTIENKEYIYNKMPIKTTLSIGMSVLNKDNIVIEDLYKEADLQLYDAKEKGRNRVCP